MSANNYHITPDGPAVCEAKERTCIYGKQVGKKHYESMEEAQTAFSETMGGSFSSLVQDRETAHDPKTSSTRLSKLSKHKDLKVQRAVVLHPKVTGKILQSMSENPNVMIRADIANNTKTPLETLQKLQEDNDILVASRAVRNPSASSEMVNRAALSSDPVLKLAASKNPSGHLSETSVEALLKTRNYDILANIIDNEKVSEENKVKAVIEPRLATQTLKREDASYDAIERSWYVQLDSREEINPEPYVKHANTPDFVLDEIALDETYKEEIRTQASQRLANKIK